MNMPLISIIMPVYNAECYLNQGILSCLNQSYQNIELILIDDGSTDKSIEIINNIIDKESGLNFSLPQLIKGLQRQEI